MSRWKLHTEWDFPIHHSEVRSKEGVRLSRPPGVPAALQPAEVVRKYEMWRKGRNNSSACGLADMLLSASGEERHSMSTIPAAPVKRHAWVCRPAVSGRCWP